MWLPHVQANVDLPDPKPDARRCPCWVQDLENPAVCFYCGRPEDTHDEMARFGPMRKDKK